MNNRLLKGKYYIKDRVEFEGEFKTDKFRNVYKWSGKGYDENGNVIYELINGNGKIREYYIKGKLSFKGEYLNGERNGKGKEYYYSNGKLQYEGEYLNGKRHGKGKEYAENGQLIFEGEYKDGWSCK